MRIDDPRQRTVGRVVSSSAAAHPHKPLFLVGDEVVTYQDLDRQSNRLAHGLSAHGIRSAENVLLMLPDHVDFIALWVGLSKLGAIEVPINRDYRGDILAHVVNDSQAETLVIDATYVERLREIAPRLDHLRHVIVYPDLESDRAADGALDWHAYPPLLHENSEPVDVPVRAHDLAAILYTSGTTGPSKGVMIYHGHAYEYSNCMAQALALDENDVYFAPLPLFHIAGQWAVVYAAMIADAPVVLAERFSVSQFWSTIARYRANTTLLLDVMASYLLSRPEQSDDADNPLEKVHMSAVLPNVDTFKRRFGVKVTTDLASTEMCAPLRAGFRPGRTEFYDLPDYRSCGRVVSDRFEVRLVDANDEEVPVGEVGELAVRARQPWTLMAGYWNNPQATVAAWRNLWLHTGDALYRDEAGEYYFVDRMRDVIRRRGENISSMEIENAINAHPEVAECAVFGVKTVHGDEDVMAMIAIRPERVVEPPALIDCLRASLAEFMLPRYVELVEAIPKTQTGKIQKYALRERGVGPDTWDREA